MLDDVIRFVGQRVAAVVASTAAAAEEACRRIEVEYVVLPAVFDPDEARQPGAPILHPEASLLDRVREAGRNVIASIHDGIGGDADERWPRRTPPCPDAGRPNASRTPSWRRTAASAGSNRPTTATTAGW